VTAESPSSSPSAATEGMSENFDPVSYVIKIILQTGREEAFTEQLNQFINRKESEIEKMCNFHYQVCQNNMLC
jgi:hypothetical protein